MPPKSRCKVPKASKENIGVSCKTKQKATSRVTKLPRKALADKTNSASDDNTSFLQSKPSVNVIDNEENLLIKQRPRRERRIPRRYVENNRIQNLSECKITPVEKEDICKLSCMKSIPVVVLSPLKTPRLILDNSLTTSRPKRICRLPSKFADHTVSPSKYVPVQPDYTSTPKIISNPAKLNKANSNKKMRSKKTLPSNKVILTKGNNKRTVNKKSNDVSKTISPNSSADTNNNAKTDLLPHSKTKNKQNISPNLSVANDKAKVSKKLVDKKKSIRILEDKKKSLKRDVSNFDIYEFTYDPNEEPPPQKKKRKKPVKKREPKLKTVVFKDNYDKNLAKALASLTKTISKQTPKLSVASDKAKILTTQTCTAHPVTDTVVTTVNIQPMPSSNPCKSDKSHNSLKTYNSVRVEDIALDIEHNSFVDDVNYSPVHSFCQPSTPATQNDILNSEKALNTPAHQNNILNSERSTSNNDPLNLRDDLSFFDDQPVASSSMNVSTRNPAASPWRVEFGSLPIKWQVNTYVKPNMTPAFECSFLNFNDSKKKHVYTNMVPDTNEENDLPQIYEDYASKLKQTSIISFIKEVVEKNAKKKKEKMTPIKANSVFQDPNTSVYNCATLAQNYHVTPKKNAQDNVQSNDQGTPLSENDNDISKEDEYIPSSCNENEKEGSKECFKSSSKKTRDKNITYFGFDDSESYDQENISPVKKLDKLNLRALKPRSRTVLQEINEQKGPSRAMLPVAVKSKLIQKSEPANKLFDQMKSATEPPVFQDDDHLQSTNITEIQNIVPSNDDQSVHLFEDIEMVHNLKAHRKSYGKAKKAVTFRQNSVSDGDVPPSDVAEQSVSSDEDDLYDLTFKVPAIEPKKNTRKKKSKKPKISKKEEQEVEAWAAGFNSMCEDIEEFDLVVE